MEKNTKINKCFFSISLKNGITITGQNPIVVRQFIRNLYSACVDSKEISKEQGFDCFAKIMDEYISELSNANKTITNNYKH